VDNESQQRAAEMWQSVFNKDCKKVIGLNTGGSWPTKRWIREGFSVLADKILEHGYGVAFFGGPMDNDNVSEITNLMKNKNSDLAIFAGKTTLIEMAALVQKCAALVTGDSGPMHIAVSQQIPVVAIFGPSDYHRYYPYQQKQNIITSKHSCLGCGQHYCTHHSCMKDITVEMIWTKLQDVLKQ
jgi:heptosyltransferase-2